MMKESDGNPIAVAAQGFVLAYCMAFTMIGFTMGAALPAFLSILFPGSDVVWCAAISMAFAGVVLSAVENRKAKRRTDELIRKLEDKP